MHSASIPRPQLERHADMDAGAPNPYHAPGRRISVFQVGSGWWPEQKGGAENVFFNLYRELGRHGFQLSGIVPGTATIERSTGGAMRSFAAECSLPKRMAAIRHSARSSFATERPDIVASHFAFYTLPLLDKVRHIPLVSHFHGPWGLESLVENGFRLTSKTKMLIERLVYRRARRVIVLSQAFGRIAQEQYGVADDVLRLIPGGVDCRQFSCSVPKADARSALGWDANRPAIFVIRRLVRRMGIDRLIEAMALVHTHPRGHSAVLHIAGSGPERVALERLVAERGLSDVVRFEGFMADDKLQLAYRAAEMTVIPTLALEGFGLVALESMASGTAVLTTPVGGLPEVVAGLSEAMVLGGADVGSIAAGITEALADPSFLPTEQACCDYARSKFDWSVVVPQIASVYREALQ